MLATRDPKCLFRRCTTQSTRLRYSIRAPRNQIMRSLLSLIIQLSRARRELRSPCTKAVCCRTQILQTPCLCQLKINRSRFLKSRFSSTTWARQRKTLSMRISCRSCRSIIWVLRGRQAPLSNSKGVSQPSP